jgi:hypothetical protein
MADPEQREQESRDEPETKFHQHREDEEERRDELADDLRAPKLTPQDDEAR